MKNPRLYITLDERTSKAIKATATRRGVSESQVARELIEEGMKVQANVDQMDLITKIIRQQLEMLMDGYVERLAALSAKGAIMSASATYLTAETIAKFVPLELQEDYLEVYEKARKKAVAYIHSRKDDIDTPHA